MINFLEVVASFVTLGILLDKLFPHVIHFAGPGPHAGGVGVSLTDSIERAYTIVFIKFFQKKSPWSIGYGLRAAFLSGLSICAVYALKSFAGGINPLPDSFEWRNWCAVGVIVLSTLIVDWISIVQSQFFFKWARHAENKWELAVAVASDMFITINTFVIFFSIVAFFPLTSLLRGVTPGAAPGNIKTIYDISNVEEYEGFLEGTLLGSLRDEDGGSWGDVGAMQLIAVRAVFSDNPMLIGPLLSSEVVAYKDFHYYIVDHKGERKSVSGAQEISDVMAGEDDSIDFHEAEILGVGELRHVPAAFFRFHWFYEYIHRIEADPVSAVLDPIDPTTLFRFLGRSPGYSPAATEPLLLCLGLPQRFGEFAVALPVDLVEHSWRTAKKRPETLDEAFSAIKQNLGCPVVAYVPVGGGYVSDQESSLLYFEGSPFLMLVDPKVFYASSLLITALLYAVVWTHVVAISLVKMFSWIRARIVFVERAPFSVAMFVLGVVFYLWR